MILNLFEEGSKEKEFKEESEEGSKEELDKRSKERITKSLDLSDIEKGERQTFKTEKNA